ncbi:MAG: hypothetical protein M1480_11430 [Bacteroidetes bacterium]|nr:hypothetical protein [Bacteroidota bacterium]
MTREEKYKILKTVFWDYNTGKLPMDKIISRNFNSIEEYEFKLMLNRMLERLSWYELLDIIGVDLIKELLTSEAIGRLRSQDLKDRYERIRRILFKEPLPFSGWDSEYRKRIKATLLSNRWYRA